MTYVDHHDACFRHGHAPNERDVILNWRAFTDARLRWLYGPNHKTERAAMTAADIAAWKRLGNPTGRAA